ncbi:MAG TPA: hypothetical protein VLG50_02485, partial [Candidatus Saccharimonadales bacterium]|nr:hypothetical protein [Candidatus Saccharimonadales bacterium]
NVPNVPFAQVNLLEAFVYATLNSFPAINPHPVFSGVPEFRLAQHSSPSPIYFDNKENQHP